MFMYEHNNKWSQKQEANCKNFHDDQRNIPSTNKIFLYEDSFFSLIHWHSSMKFIMVCFILQANALYSHKPITISLLRKSCENITPQMDNTMLKKKKKESCGRIPACFVLFHNMYNFVNIIMLHAQSPQNCLCGI